MRLIDAEKMKTELLWGNAYLSDNETNTLVDLIDNQPTIDPGSTVPRWIPVTERLPETGEVLATNGDVIAVAPASSVRRKDTYITHWMPLPELPGGGDPDDPA